jgi:hypothetical protein
MPALAQVNLDDHAVMVLSTAMLAHHPAGQWFSCPGTLLKERSLDSQCHEWCASRRNDVPDSDFSLGKIPLLHRSLRLANRRHHPRTYRALLMLHLHHLAATACLDGNLQRIKLGLLYT